MGAIGSDLSAGLLLNGAAALFGLASLLLLDRIVGRRWRADRADRLTLEALQMARVAADPTEPDMARALANKRLEDLGYTDEWLVSQKARVIAAGEAIFPGVAAESRGAHGPDLSGLVRLIWALDRGFELARREAKPEEDSAVRIFIVLVWFALMFAGIGLAAVLRALG